MHRICQVTAAHGIDEVDLRSVLGIPTAFGAGYHTTLEDLEECETEPLLFTHKKRTERRAR